MRRGLVQPSVNPRRTNPPIAVQILAVGARSRLALLRKRWSPFWEHVSAPKIMKCPCDGECQGSGGRAALFDSARRDASRHCAAACAPLAHDPTHCRADVSRRRACTLSPAAQTMVTVLGTCFGAQNYEMLWWRRVCNLLVVVSFIRFVVAAHARDIESAGYVTA